MKSVASLLPYVVVVVVVVDILKRKRKVTFSWKGDDGAGWKQETGRMTNPVSSELTSQNGYLDPSSLRFLAFLFT